MSGRIRERRFLRRPKLSPDRPAALKPGTAHTVELRLAEPSKTPAGAPAPEVTLRVRVRKLPRAEDLSVTFNAHALHVAGKSGAWLDYPVAPALLKRGPNQVAVTLAASAPPGPGLQDLALRVRHKKTP